MMTAPASVSPFFLEQCQGTQIFSGRFAHQRQRVVPLTGWQLADNR
jgi:hypothetical protein